MSIFHQSPQNLTDWEGLFPEENEANKKAIDGYTRVFRKWKTKTYRRVDHT